MSNLLQQEANSGSTWGWLFLVRSQEQQVRLPCFFRYGCTLNLLVLTIGLI